METLEVGQGLVDLCKQGKFNEAIDQYYSDDIVSIEGASMPGMERRMEGIQAVRGKNEWWAANHEVHDMKVEGPFVAEDDDHFMTVFHIDVTGNYDNKRTKSSEVAVYKVEDGKIVEERFYFQSK